MRIGIDCRLWNESGVGRYIRNLVGGLYRLDKQNEYCLFVFSQDADRIKNQELRIKDDKWRFVLTDIRWHTLEEQIKFPKILNKENLDLAHFPYISVPVFYNKPFIVTIHDLIPFSFPTGQASTLPLPLYYLKLAGYKYVIKKAAQKAKKIITVSQSSKKEIINYLHVQGNKIEVTYEGTDRTISNFKFQISNSSIHNKLQNSKYFLYVGSAYPHKNLERLIKAFSLVCQNDIKLVLAGKEDFFYKGLKQKVKQLELEEHIIFTDYVTDEDLMNLYKNALAFVSPSLREGFGLPIVEAMAMKCLAIVSDIPVFREICDNAAIYFDPCKLSDMVEKLNSVLSSKDSFNTLKEKGFEISKIYSWEKTAEKTLQIYQSISPKR